MWRFYFRDELVSPSWVEVEEPEGWDALEESLQRSDLYSGLDNTYSDSLIFSLTGANYLEAKFVLYSFDGLIDFKAEYTCNSVVEQTIQGIVNLAFYKNEQGRISVNFEDTSFQRKFLSRIETPVNLENDESIEGAAITSLTREEIRAHSKQINFTAQYNVNSALRNLHFTDRPNAHTTPWSFIGGDIVGATEPTTTEPSGAGRSILVNNTSVEQNITIEGRVIISPLASITRDDLNVYTYTGGFNYLYSDSDGSHVIFSAAGVEQATADPYDFSFSINVRLEPGANCIITYFDAYEETLPGTSTLARDQTYIYGDECSLSLEEVSIYPTSTIEGFKIYEALNKVTEAITDRVDAIRSDFFGRTDSSPESYYSTGCGAQAIFTNGVNIRNMLDSNGDKFPIYASFKQLFDALNTVIGIGFAIEKIGGVPYLRIEPVEYFYNNNVAFSFTNVSDLIISAAPTYAYNEIEIGFNNWTIENTNGIDEFNTKHIYAFPVKNVKNRLTRTTDVITGGYAIEATRRQQFSSQPTTDWKYDNNLFLISLNRSDVTFDTEEEDPYFVSDDSYPRTYPAGTITERDEAFAIVENVISPETSYNLRYSPARCMANNYRYVSGTIAHNPTLPLRFQSGEGNVIMITELDDGCDTIDGQIAENQDINSSNVFNPNAYFEPVMLEFSYPITRVQFQAIKDSLNKTIKVSCGGPAIGGTIKELKYIYNTQGGMLQVSALRIPCIPGAFSDGFSSGFDIGEC